MARPFPLSSFRLGCLTSSSSSSSPSSSLSPSTPPFIFSLNGFRLGPVLPLEPGERGEGREPVCESGEVMYRLASRDGVGVVVLWRGRSGSDSLGWSEDMSLIGEEGTVKMC